ncbi:MAG: nitrite reductase large subunit [Propionibacteriales bacterium]|nr:nitrite reductase large subunit [Propionibacteriales bacterium]
MPQPRKTLVVVGHGPVGHCLVEAALERGLTGGWDVVVLGEEPRPAYDRVGLTSYFSHLDPDELSLLPTGGYDDPHVRLHTGQTVTEIDRARRCVVTDRGDVHDYHALVLATGSYPFVPPIPGHDADGCFVYRTIEDLEAIRSEAGSARAGIVIGGGLLGLEAANALKQLGVQTHVVEMAGRPMPMQVDDAGGAMLRRCIEDLGVRLHCGVRTTAIETGDDGRIARLVLDEGDPIDADLLVFSAGIRPRDQLARECGLEVGERGGVLVDEQCRSINDPDVFAVGECAAPGGRVYGLVAPGYAMAETVVDHLLDGGGVFAGADMSTKLKLLGVDVASFGDAFGTAEDSLELVFSDAVAGVYKKLVVDADGRRLLGGVLVGDASSYGLLRPMASSGQTIKGNVEDLILPAGGGPGAGADALPDEAVVCNCRNVTRGAICETIRTEGCSGMACVKSCTTAGTVCGSCVPVVKSLLEGELKAQGVEVSKGICEHFELTRQELYDVIKVKRIRTFAELLETHGQGSGCDVCKPAVASIMASQTGRYVLDKSTASLQDTNDWYLANLQRNGTYSVVPRVPGGEITPDKLIVIGEVARDFGLYTKITGGQRIDLFGARVEQLPAIWRRLVDAGFESGHAYGKALRTVKSCVGSTWCRYGVQDSVEMAIELELRYRGLRSPHKIKAGVSGCARECAEARAKDIGVIATERGWNLYVAGNGGFSPRHAQEFATDLDRDTLIAYIDRFLMYYIRTADRLQRTAPWVESIEGGLDHVRSVVVDDALGLAAELEADMARHVSSYADEWKATLEDPEALRRFVSFVNAPDVSDPSITWDIERDQIRPRAGADEPATEGAPVVVAGAQIPVGAPS